MTDLTQMTEAEYRVWRLTKVTCLGCELLIDPADLCGACLYEGEYRTIPLIPAAALHMAKKMCNRPLFDVRPKVAR